MLLGSTLYRRPPGTEPLLKLYHQLRSWVGCGWSEGLPVAAKDFFALLIVVVLWHPISTIVILFCCFYFAGHYASSGKNAQEIVWETKCIVRITLNLFSLMQDMTMTSSKSLATPMRNFLVKISSDSYNFTAWDNLQWHVECLQATAELITEHIHVLMKWCSTTCSAHICELVVLAWSLCSPTCTGLSAIVKLPKMTL